MLSFICLIGKRMFACQTLTGNRSAFAFAQDGPSTDLDFICRMCRGRRLWETGERESVERGVGRRVQSQSC